MYDVGPGVDAGAGAGADANAGVGAGAEVGAGAGASAGADVGVNAESPSSHDAQISEKPSVHVMHGCTLVYIFQKNDTVLRVWLVCGSCVARVAASVWPPPSWLRSGCRLRGF